MLSSQMGLFERTFNCIQFSCSFAQLQGYVYWVTSKGFLRFPHLGDLALKIPSLGAPIQKVSSQQRPQPVGTHSRGVSNLRIISLRTLDPEGLTLDGYLDFKQNKTYPYRPTYPFLAFRAFGPKLMYRKVCVLCLQMELFEQTLNFRQFIYSFTHIKRFLSIGGILKLHKKGHCEDIVKLTNR